MSKSRWRFGLSGPHAPQDVSKPVPAPTLASADSKKFGLENYCNNCYVNSVVQALYFCAPFRDLMLQSPDTSFSQPTSTPSQPSTTAEIIVPPPSAATRPKPERKLSTSAVVDSPPLPVTPIPPSPPSLFSALRSLFVYISTNPAQSGTVSPRVFIDKLKELNRVFDNTTHQDAHEFLNYLLNRIVEEVEEEQRTGRVEAPTEDLANSVATLQSEPRTLDSRTGNSSNHATLVHKLFEGALTSETRCLTCETVSSRDESFLDLSIDIEQNSSVTACLRQFSASEMLCHKNKFFCDSCCDLQEAEKRMKIKRLPNVLALHLKRFKYQEDLQRYVKLAYRVAFPFELRLFNTVDDLDDADRLYNLSGIVVHIGNGPHHGHYVSIIKTMGKWLLFDDDTVSSVAEADIPKYYGDSPAGAAYVLYYQAADIDPHKLGLRIDQNSGDAATASTTSQPTQAPVHPPGLIPEDVSTSAQAHTPSSSSVSDAEPSTPPPSSPIIIPSKPALPPPSMSASASTSHSTASGSSASPSSSPLASVLPSPLHTSKVSVSNIIKTIRRAPSVSTRTNVTQSMGRATTQTPQTPNSTFPFNNAGPVPPLPGAVGPDQGATTGTTLESSNVPGADSLQSPGQPKDEMTMDPRLATRPATVHGRTGSEVRALPPQPRPATGGDKEKEGTKKWFWRAAGHDLPPEPATLASGGDTVGNSGERTEGGSVRVLGDVDPNTYVNGDAVLSGVGYRERKEHKDKDKSKKSGAGAWFVKRKSFRSAEKALRGLVGSNHDADVTPTSSVTTHDDDRLRTSLQYSTRESGSMDVERGSEQTVTSHLVADDPARLKSSSSKRQSQPLSSNNLKQAYNHLTSHVHGYNSVNGDLSPPASSQSSLDQPPLVNGTPTLALSPATMVPNSPTSLRHSQSLANPLRSQSRPHPLPRPPSHVVNGYPTISAPRLHGSVSAAPDSPTTTTPTSIHTPTHTGFSSAPALSHVRALPQAPLHTVTSDRKQSLIDHFEPRGVTEKGQTGRSERTRDSAGMPLAHSRLSTVGGESGRSGDRPLPPIPPRLSGPRLQHSHQRQGSFGDGILVDELFSGKGPSAGDDSSRVLQTSPPPSLGSFGSANSSSGAASNGSGHMALKKATRKLSLTAPMLGFGKREKERDGKTREKAAPSSFMPF